MSENHLTEFPITVSLIHKLHQKNRLVHSNLTMALMHKGQ